VSGPRDRDDRDETAAIFARIPRAEAEKLNRLSFELKRPKQEIIAGLVAQYGGPEGEHPPPESAATAPWRLGRVALHPADAPEVLTLAQLAEFLQLSEESTRALAESGEIPGRRIGDEWRFARGAVLEWLAGKSE
jgi:excisionase family DNA binding protein